MPREGRKERLGVVEAEKAEKPAKRSPAGLVSVRYGVVVFVASQRALHSEPGQDETRAQAVGGGLGGGTD